MTDNLILLVTNIPNPYRLALFNELNVRFKQMNYRFMVLFGAFTYSRRKYKLNTDSFQFSHTVLKSNTIHFGNNEHTYISYAGLCRKIISLKPAIVITSGFNLATVKVAILSLFMPFKLIIWSGSIIKPGRNDSLLRKLFRKLLMKCSTAFVVYGSKANNYLQSLGANQKQIFTAINTVDTQYFREESIKRKALIRKNPPYHFCTIGYLSKRKNGITMLKAVKRLSEQNDNFVLDIIGDGNDLDNLKAFVEENNLQSMVVFHGYKQQHELPDFLANSIGFLFQTDFDIWGLVLNEAMASGVPCISSVNAAATHDLIIHNKNGFAVNFDDTVATAACMNYLLQHTEKAEKMGLEAAAHIQETATIEISAEGFLKAVAFCRRHEI